MQCVKSLCPPAAVISAKVVKGKDEEAAKYRDYFDFSSPLKRCTSHRLLAIRRAEAEGLLKVSITPDDDQRLERLDRQLSVAITNAAARWQKPYRMPTAVC